MSLHWGKRVEQEFSIQLHLIVTAGILDGLWRHMMQSDHFVTSTQHWLNDAASEWLSRRRQHTGRSEKVHITIIWLALGDVRWFQGQHHPTQYTFNTRLIVVYVSLCIVSCRMFMNNAILLCSVDICLFAERFFLLLFFFVCVLFVLRVPFDDKRAVCDVRACAAKWTTFNAMKLQHETKPNCVVKSVSRFFPFHFEQISRKRKMHCFHLARTGYSTVKL